MRHTLSPGDLTRRFAVAVLAVLQLAAAGLVPAADAELWGDSVESTLHVESQGSKECAPPHDHLFCQLCRTHLLAGMTAPVHDALPLTLPSLVAHAGQAAHTPAAATLLAGASGPRAPPIA